MSTHWVNLILIGAAFGIAVTIILYLEEKRRNAQFRQGLELDLKRAEEGRKNIFEKVKALQQASSEFTESETEHDIIQSILKFSMDLSGAMGASFVPLDERNQPVAVMKKGETPIPIPDAWLEYLASPAVRQNCAQCNQDETVVRSCALLKAPFSEATGLTCFPLRYANQELGILSLYLDKEGEIDADRLVLLRMLLATAALALAGDRFHRREQTKQNQIQAVRQRADFTPNSDQMAEFEYRVIMEERRRLAREIHDGLAQNLGLLKMQVAQMKGFMEKSDLERLDRMIHRSYDVLSVAYQDVREAIDALRLSPGSNPGFRLQDWIQQIVVEFASADTFHPVEVVIKDLEVPSILPLSQHAQLIRVVQEAMSNVRKHANAKHVWISCREEERDLIIEIQDDGQGYDAEDVPGISQHGLRGMRERAELIGADFQIQSRINEGTIVRVSLPLETQKWLET